LSGRAKADCWIWRPYTAGEGFAYAYEAEWNDFPYRSVVIGEPVSEPFPEVTFGRFSHEGPLPDALGGPFGCVIAAPNLRELLTRESGAPIQWIPVKLRRRSSPPYAIANVLMRLPCLDEQRSQLTRDEEGFVDAVTRLALRPLPADAPGIFHLAEMRSVLVVQEQLRRQMEATSPSPGRFIAVDEYELG
jgi:hypothetical protein